MATFSLGTSGVTPGAPGVYINEQAGKLANAELAGFDTVYMLVETEEDVSVTQFPFNTPVAITSLNDYKELIRVGTSTVPDSRIPLLSYNCVNEFFENAQVGDLRVVRVGTPDQIVEVELFPSATKLNSTDLPSALQAGNVVYIQMTINGLKLVAGDGSTGYTSSGEWLGVPVTIPVTYVANDEVNNRKIADAMRLAVAEAIESNPAVNASVYVRESGLVNDRDPAANSENAFVTLASTTFNGNVSVVTQVLPVGANFVFMQNAYDVTNVVGGSTKLVRVPQDYTQCIATSFDGQQDQGYLITPTAYAQFNAEGRALVGAAAAAHCEDNNYKWMALADPGPFLVTDVNEYSEFSPHNAAADLEEGKSYLVDNAIYEWVGNDVSYNKLDYQSIVSGKNAETAVNEAANLVADATQVGLLDPGQYTISTLPDSADGLFTLTTGVWPVTLPVQKVTLTGATGTNEFTNVDVQGGSTGVNLNGQEVYIVAPPYDLSEGSEYPENRVFLALTAGDASNIYNAVVLAGGSINIVAGGTPPTGAVFIPGTPLGDNALISYNAPYWDLPVEINGQTSDLIENISGADAGVNTLHLPGTLQDPTAEYALRWISRTFFDPSAQIAAASGITGVADGTAVFTCVKHGLTTGQTVFWTNPITITDSSGNTTNLISPTTQQVQRPYLVKALTTDTFILASSLGNYSNSSFVTLPTGTIQSHLSVVYSQVMGRDVNSINEAALTTLPLVRGRKYAFGSNTIWNKALSASKSPTGTVGQDGFDTQILFNDSANVVSGASISNYGEDISSATQCDYLPALNTVNPTPNPVAATTNAYCVPTVDQFFSSESYIVPTLEPSKAGDYDPGVTGTIGPVLTATISVATAVTAPGTYNNIALTSVTGTGSGAEASITVDNAQTITDIVITKTGQGYVAGDTLGVPASFGGGSAQFTVDTIDDANGSVTAVTPAGLAVGLAVGYTAAQVQYIQNQLAGTYLIVLNNSGTAPNGDAVVPGDAIVYKYEDQAYTSTIVSDYTNAKFEGNIVLYGAQVELVYTPEQGVPKDLWRFDAITSTEIIDNALRGVGFNGEPQATLVEAGVDNVNRLYDDSQRYFNPFGFIAYYGPYIENGAGQFIPPSPYVTGVAVRRYRSEGYQFPPAGVKFQLADAVGVQIPINSAQQNRLNPDGCNVIRTLPGYPQAAVFIWGGRTRVNSADAQQRLYQFVNTRVILNVVYGSLRSAFDTQIFNVIDGFGVIYNQIISVGNSILNQLYIRGALYGAKPSDAFQVICDNRINSAEDLENGIVNAKVFVTPVPTLERIQIDLIRVALGKMQQELDVQGLGS